MIWSMLSDDFPDDQWALDVVAWLEGVPADRLRKVSEALVDSAVLSMKAMQPIGPELLSVLMSVEYATRYLADERLLHLPDDALRLWVHGTAMAMEAGIPYFIAYGDVLQITPSLDALQQLLSDGPWLPDLEGYDAPHASEVYPSALASGAEVTLIRDRLFAVVPELGQQLAPAVEPSAQEGPHESSRRADGVTRAN